MKSRIASLLMPCLAGLGLVAMNSCAPIAPRERMGCSAEVRKQSSMDYGTFKQMMGGAGGVALVDEAKGNEKRGREVVKVESLAKGNRGGLGKERWTVRHADGSEARYEVTWDGPRMEVVGKKELGKQGR